MRFTIRDLLWLMVVVALSVAWSMDRQRAADAATKRESLWEEAVTRMVSDLYDATGRYVSVTTPDGKVIFSEPYDGGTVSGSYDGGTVPGSVAPASNLPKK